MGLLRKHKKEIREGPAEAPPVYLDARTEFAGRFLVGEGLEIGPLHQPLAIPPHAQVRYVDRLTVEELRKEYSDLADRDLTRVDIVDDGERLTTIPDTSQDFIVANHFLEHCEDPIGTIRVHLRKLKLGGVLFYAVPDKRYTFDFRRPITPLDHMVADYEHGPEGSRRGHYQEWTRLVAEQPPGPAPQDTWSEERLDARANEIEAAEYSIHMHVWTQADFLKLILDCRDRFEDGFDIEAAARQAIEFVVVLRKQGPSPVPTAERPASANGPRNEELWQANQRLERQVHDLTSSSSWRLTKPLRAAKGALRKRGLFRKRA